VLMVLCDGMGGLANGALAAQKAVDAILAGYQRKTPSESIGRALERSIRDAQRAVEDVTGDGKQAGTTVVAAVVAGGRLYWASLGDSRLYLCRGNAPAKQLTQDHNLAAALQRGLARGDLTTEEAAARDGEREALTAYLGSPHSPQPDMCQDGMALHSGDRILACSDGLYRGLPEVTIARVGRGKDPMTAAELLVKAVLAQEQPHQDNVTVTILDVARPYLPKFMRNPVVRAVAATILAMALLTAAAIYVAWRLQLRPPALFSSTARVAAPAGTVRPVPVATAPAPSPPPPPVAEQTPAPAKDPPQPSLGEILEVAEKAAKDARDALIAAENRARGAVAPRDRIGAQEVTEAVGEVRQGASEAEAAARAIRLIADLKAADLSGSVGDIEALKHLVAEKLKEIAVQASGKAMQAVENVPAVPPPPTPPPAPRAALAASHPQQAHRGAAAPHRQQRPPPPPPGQH